MKNLHNALDAETEKIDRVLKMARFMLRQPSQKAIYAYENQLLEKDSLDLVISSRAERIVLSSSMD